MIVVDGHVFRIEGNGRISEVGPADETVDDAAFKALVKEAVAFNVAKQKPQRA